MIRHEEFERLRLASYLPLDQIDVVEDFEFMGRVWVGETSGFTEWLRHGQRNSRLGSVSLDLVELPAITSSAILESLQLPLRRGMTLVEIRDLFGEADEVETFVSDRKSYNFSRQLPDPYEISCTVGDEDGLIYVVVMVPDAGNVEP